MTLDQIEALDEPVECDRCGNRPALVLVRDGKRMICHRCNEKTECTNCEQELPRYQMVKCEPGLFCWICCDMDPEDFW
jgi:hypothetical protein